MVREIVIVSTCTNQKKGQVDRDLHLGRWAGQFYREVARKWVDALEAARGPHVAASELYLGSHWQETLACVESSRNAGLKPSLCILSAGYGFLMGDEEVVPYAASFAGGVDSVQNLLWPDEPQPKRRAQSWWRTLQKYRNCGGMSLLAGRVAEGVPVLMIMSKEYYAAVEPEVIDLISDGLNVLIVSAGLFRNLSSVSPVVRPHVLPFSDSFKQVEDYLNKTNVSLNARLANWLIRNHSNSLEKGISVIGPKLKKIAGKLPAMERRDVNPMTDEEVLEYIGRNFSAENNSATKLLRRLRHVEGMSCEQKRFGALFRKYEQSLQGDLFDYD